MKHIATIGFFDGVHRGHQYLFAALGREASVRGLQPMVVTFDRHPRTVLCPDSPMPLLMSVDMRREQLRTYGEVVVLDFDEVHTLTAEAFMTLLRDRYEVQTLVMGYDHSFGSDRLQGVEAYRRVGERVGVEVVIAAECDEVCGHVSSTAIRNAITVGEVDLAARMLGRSYALMGRVVHGRALGREMGFPTANLCLDEPAQLLPRYGVYAVEVLLVDGRTYSAIMNVGLNPTVGNTAPSVEIHIPHYEGDLYDSHICVSLLRFIRPEQHFSSLEALRKQIELDLAQL